MSFKKTAFPSRKQVIGTAEVLLWVVSAGALILALWMVADGYLFQLKADSLQTPESFRLMAEGPSTLEGELPVPLEETAFRSRDLPEPGTPIARLEIPRLDLSVAVAEGASSDTLRKAVGRVPRTALPGERGNVALAGHRDTFFRPLKDIEVGDRILLSSSAGIETYRVSWTKVVEPVDVSVLDASDEPVLTLVTCYPFHWVGNAPQRFIVRARLEEARSGSETPGQVS